MRALDARDILRLWEAGAALHPIDRVLEMLRIATPEDEAADQLASLPIGERERRAAALRLASFGGHAEGSSACPSCDLVHEVDPPLRELIEAAPADPARFEVVAGDYHLVARLPDSHDQAELTRHADPERALAALVARCVVTAQRDGQPVANRELPAEVVAALADAITERDHNAETLIHMSCTGCGQRWTTLFDAGQFLWDEVTVRAHRLFYEVHTLAAAYHWSEADILAMSARRREAYLEMVGA